MRGHVFDIEEIRVRSHPKFHIVVVANPWNFASFGSGLPRSLLAKLVYFRLCDSSTASSLIMKFHVRYMFALCTQLRKWMIQARI